MDLTVLIGSAGSGDRVYAAGLDDPGKFSGFFAVDLCFDDPGPVCKGEVGELFTAFASKVGAFYQKEGVYGGGLGYVLYELGFFHGVCSIVVCFRE